MYEFMGMYYSPWTERARWALDYHKLPYRYTEYTTLLGEPLLRLKAGKPFGKVSVPLLTAPGKRVNDSFEIAGFADANSRENPLIPAAHFDDIKRWIESAELALCSARIRATRRIRDSSAALAERLPAYTPGILRKPLAPMAYLATQYILHKYDLEDDSDEKLFGNMDDFFGSADKILKGKKHIHEAFSFADIVIATALQAVTPVDNKYIYLGEASRKCMCEPELALKYPALIAWRDETYEKYR